MKKWCSILMLLFLMQTHYAQKFEIGYELGSGFAGKYYSHSSIKAISIFAVDFKSVRTGISTYLSSDSSYIAFKSGIFYLPMFSEKLNYMNIIQLPIGIEVSPFKKNNFIFGLGINFNYLMDNDIVDIVFQDYQIGLYTNVGWFYPINKKLTVDFKAQYGYDLTKLYTSETYSPIGVRFFIDTFSTNLFLALSFRYKICTKAKSSA